MGVRALTVLVAVAVCSTPVFAQVNLTAPPNLDAAIRRALLEERPHLELVEPSAKALLRANVEARIDGYYLSIETSDGVVDARPLGSEVPAATRLSVLLIVRAVDELAGSALSPEVAHRNLGIRLQLDGGLLMWSQPSSVRAGGGVVGLLEVGSVLSFGVRLSVAGFCCAVRGDNVDADAWFIAGWAEARARWPLGRLAPLALVAVGIGQDTVRATAVGVFEGPAAPETRTVVGAVFRAGFGGRLELIDGWSLVAVGGLQLHARDLAVRLPEVVAEGRDPLRRGRALPFAQIGVAAVVF